jgi:superfamily II DNA or RNA helicase
MIRISIIDSVMSQVQYDTEEELSLVRSILFLTREKRIRTEKIARNKWKTSTTEEEVPLITDEGFFLTGLYPRLIENFKKKQIPYEATVLDERKYASTHPKDLQLKDIKLYADQIDLLIKAGKQQRGVLQAPTGTGKTILAYALISMFSATPGKALIICPSKSIMKQTEHDFREKFGFQTSIVGDGNKDLRGDVVVAIINSLNRIPPESLANIFKIVIVDEAHHVASFSGMFYSVMTTIKAPIRLGLTATPLNSNTEGGMACEALLGPVIGKFTVPEAIEANRIIKPELVLLPVPQNSNLKELSKYADIYNMGIVYNRMRNNIAAKFIQKNTEEGSSAIVFTRILAHASILYEMISARGVPCSLVTGAVSATIREELRRQLNNKQISCIIATAAWKEGINIPSLDIVMNAAGYLSNNTVTQMAGRGTRIFEGKNPKMVDFLDIGRYLSVHTVHRMQTYSQLGWL